MEELYRRIEVLEEKVKKLESYFVLQTSAGEADKTNYKYVSEHGNDSKVKTVMEPVEYAPADPRNFSYEMETGVFFSERYGSEKSYESKCEEIAHFVGKGLRITAYNGFDADTVVIPESIDGVPVISIGQRAFMNMEINAVVIPDSVKIISPKAFYNCKNLKNLVLPKNLEYLGDWCFHGCGFSEISIPDTVSVIPHCCFGECKSLTTVVFGRNVQKLGTAAFLGCEQLKNLLLPESLIELQKSCFSSTSISTLVIPESVKLISNEIFDGRLKKNYISIVICGMETKITEGDFYGVETVYCLPGSTAQKFSREHRITLKPLWEYSPDTEI